MKFIKLSTLLLSLIGVAVFSTSCGMFGGEHPLLPEALERRGLKPNEGYIVAIFDAKAIDRNGQASKMGTLATVSIKGEGTAQGTTASLIPLSSNQQGNPYLAGGGYPSAEVAIPVPAGDYVITGWRLDSGQLIITNRKPMNARFKVEAGQATYIGSYMALSIYGKNIIGLPVLGDGIILAKDNFAVDRQRIAKKFPVIKSEKIRKSNAAQQYQSEMKRIAESPSGFLGMF